MCISNFASSFDQFHPFLDSGHIFSRINCHYFVRTVRITADFIIKRSILQAGRRNVFHKNPTSETYRCEAVGFLMAFPFFNLIFKSEMLSFDQSLVLLRSHFLRTVLQKLMMSLNSSFDVSLRIMRIPNKPQLMLNFPSDAFIITSRTTQFESLVELLPRVHDMTTSIVKLSQRHQRRGRRQKRMIRTAGTLDYRNRLHE